MAAEAATPNNGIRRGRNDALWLLALWIVLSVIGCLLVALV